MQLSQSIASILNSLEEDNVLLYADNLLLLETPERIAKIREIFKVGGSHWGDISPMGKTAEGGICEESFDAILRSDPTARIATDGSVAKCGIYTQWLCGLYVNASQSVRSRFIEDLYKATDALKLYDKHKSKLPVEMRNIMAIKSVIDLEATVAALKDAQTKGDENRAIKAGTERLLDDAAWLVLIPKTHEAACFYGAGTRWCTASANYTHYFSQYSSQGPLYLCIKKADNEKFQFHFESGQFMDAEDSQIDVEDFFKEHPTVAATIAAHKRANGKLTMADLELLQPDEVLAEYSRLEDPEATKKYLTQASATIIVRGFEAGVFKADALNAVSAATGVMFAGEGATGKIGFAVDDWSDLSDFFDDNHGRRGSTRASFLSIVGDDGISNWYEPHVDVSDAIANATPENEKRIVALCAAMEALDEDGEVEWDNLPDEVENAVRTAAERVDEQATYDLYYKKYAEAVEEVAGKSERVGDKLVLWNSVKTFKEYASDALAYLNDRNGGGARVEIGDVIGNYAAHLRDTGGCADPGDSQHWYVSVSDADFNEQLDEQLSELEAEYLKKPEIGAVPAVESRLVSRFLQSGKKARSLIEGDGQWGYDLDPDKMTRADLAMASDKDRVFASAASPAPRTFAVTFHFRNGNVKRKVTAKSAASALGLALNGRADAGMFAYEAGGYSSVGLARNAINKGEASVTVFDERFQVKCPAK